MKNIIINFIVIAFCSLQVMNAQNNNSENISFKKLMDKIFVTSIAFDNHNNAWIGTSKQGLIKYNSKETIFYTLKNSCINDTIRINDIKVDSKGNVWIGNKGLIKYDGKTFTSFNSDNSKIPSDYIRSIAIDSKDNVWLTSCTFDQGGLVKYNGENFTVFTPTNSKLPFHLIESITIDKNDNVWLATVRGVGATCLVKISNNEWTIYNNKELGFTPYYYGNIEVDSKNILYGSIDYSLSSSMGYERPLIFSIDEKKSQVLKAGKETYWKLLKIDAANRLWCADYSNYSIYDGSKWTRNELRKSGGITAIEQAADNKMWIGTSDGIYIEN